MTIERIEQNQTRKRVAVGMTGLAGVVVLIGFASAVFSLAVHGGARVPSATLAANTIVANTSEPLAEIGAAPGAADTVTSNQAGAPR